MSWQDCPDDRARGRRGNMACGRPNPRSSIPWPISRCWRTSSLLPLAQTQAWLADRDDRPDRHAVAEKAKQARSQMRRSCRSETRRNCSCGTTFRDALARGADDLLVAFSDTPLISAQTFDQLRVPLSNGAAPLRVAAFAENPSGYGRLIVEGDRLLAIREQADANAPRSAPSHSAMPA